jgi:H3 lysine-79-specific histone-lysine N-methyltransferase
MDGFLLQVTAVEHEQAKYVSLRQQEILDKYRKSGLINGACSNQQLDMSGLTQEYILKEISATLSHRKKLHSKVSRLETELTALEKVSDERKSQPPVSSSLKVSSAYTNSSIVATVAANEKVPHAHPPLQPPLMITNHHPVGPSAKPQRKSREARSRSQDWPDVPDIGKIEENNPEILAQKILETGRQIEAGKIRETTKFNGSHVSAGDGHDVTHVSNGRYGRHGVSSHPYQSQIGSTGKLTTETISVPRTTPRTGSITGSDSKAKHGRPGSANKQLVSFTSNRAQEPPRVANFEDRLKSIITSVLNEDQQNRQQQQQALMSASGYPNTSVVNAPLNGYGSSYYAGSSSHSSASGVELTKAVRECKKEERFRGRDSSVQSSRNLSTQPDYTQVSPAKLALRRHLSQEKLAAASAQQLQALGSNEKGFVATRTIGDLVSGEIERTLEISNQSIINAAVDMSTMMSATTPANIVNQNIPPRPERVNVRISRIVEDSLARKETEDHVGGNSPSPLHRTPVYSPISRPSSAEGGMSTTGNPPTPTGMLHPPTQVLEGLAYPQHRPKSPPPPPPHHGLATFHVAYTHHSAPSYPGTVAPPTYSPRTTVLYPPSSSSAYVPKTTVSQLVTSSSCRYTTSSSEGGYTPVQLPRADIKPYHESYFSDTKPLIIVNSTSEHKPSANVGTTEVSAGKLMYSRSGSESFGPVEGLAATLHARILGGQEGGSKPGQDALIVKEEADERVARRSDCMMFDEGHCHQRRESARLDQSEGKSDDRNVGMDCGETSHVASAAPVPAADVVKTEANEGVKVPDSAEDVFGRMSHHYQNGSLKRSSPVIQAPSRSHKKQLLESGMAYGETDAGVSSVSAVVSNASQPLAISAISSPELNSGKSTPVPPIEDPSERRHTEDREEGMSCSPLMAVDGLHVWWRVWRGWRLLQLAG